MEKPAKGVRQTSDVLVIDVPCGQCALAPLTSMEPKWGPFPKMTFLEKLDGCLGFQLVVEQKRTAIQSPFANPPL